MTAIKDALEALREAAKLVNEVKHSTARISELTVEIRDIDRRVSRLEGKWEAAMDFNRIGASRNASRQLPSKPKNG